MDETSRSLLERVAPAPADVATRRLLAVCYNTLAVASLKQDVAVELSRQALALRERLAVEDVGDPQGFRRRPLSLFARRGHPVDGEHESDRQGPRRPRARGGHDAEEGQEGMVR